MPRRSYNRYYTGRRSHERIENYAGRGWFDDEGGHSRAAKKGWRKRSNKRRSRSKRSRSRSRNKK